MTLSFSLRYRAIVGFLIFIESISVEATTADLGEEFYMLCQCPIGYYEAEKFAVFMDKAPTCGAPKRQVIVCPNGRRWKVDGIRCVRCHPSCLDCSGPSDEDCLRCASGLYNLTVIHQEPPAFLTSIFEEVTYNHSANDGVLFQTTEDPSSTISTGRSSDRRKPRGATTSTDAKFIEDASTMTDNSNIKPTTDYSSEENDKVEESSLEKLFKEEELFVSKSILTESPERNDVSFSKKLDKRFISFRFRDDSGSSSGLHDDRVILNPRLSVSFNINGQQQPSPTAMPPPTPPVFQLPAGILVPIRSSGHQDSRAKWEPIPPPPNPLPPGYILNPGIVGPPVGDPAINPTLIKSPLHSEMISGSTLPKKPTIVAIPPSALGNPPDRSHLINNGMTFIPTTETIMTTSTQRRTTSRVRNMVPTTIIEDVTISATSESPISHQVTHRCVIQCPNNTYPQGSSCKFCDPICASCDGPSAANCTACSAFAVMNPEDKGCLISCPENFFNSSGTCVPCHPECKGGCSGPGSENCTSCQHEWPIHSSSVSIGCFVPLTEAPPSPLEVILPITFIIVFFILGTLIFIYFKWGSSIAEWFRASFHKLRKNKNTRKDSDKPLPKQMTPKQVLKNVYTPAPPADLEKNNDKQLSQRGSSIEEDGYELPVAMTSVTVDPEPSTSSSSKGHIVRPRKNEPLPPTPVGEPNHTGYNIPKPLDSSALHLDFTKHHSSDEDDDYDDVMPPSPRMKSLSEPPLPTTNQLEVFRTNHNLPDLPGTYNNSEGLYVNC